LPIGCLPGRRLCVCTKLQRPLLFRNRRSPCHYYSSSPAGHLRSRFAGFRNRSISTIANLYGRRRQRSPEQGCVLVPLQLQSGRMRDAVRNLQRIRYRHHLHSAFTNERDCFHRSHRKFRRGSRQVRIRCHYRRRSTSAHYRQRLAADPNPYSQSDAEFRRHRSKRHTKHGRHLEHFRRELQIELVRHPIHRQQSIRRRDHLHRPSTSSQSPNRHSDRHIRRRFESLRQRDHHHSPATTTSDRHRLSRPANCPRQSLARFHRHRAKRSAKQGCDLETLGRRLHRGAMRHALRKLERIRDACHLHRPAECTQSAHGYTYRNLRHRHEILG
jgi:hypothetical protein